MRIGELANQTGVSAHTLRFYEQRGLISATRRSNGYRDYPEEMVTIVSLVKTAQTLGFTLSEIASELNNVEALSDPQKLRAIFQSKLQAVDSRIAELKGIRNEIAVLMEKTCPLTRTKPL